MRAGGAASRISAGRCSSAGKVGDRAELRRAAAAARPCRTRQGQWRHASSCRPARCSGSTRSTAAAEGEITSVRMTTRKPPAGLKGAPYLEKQRHLGRWAERSQARLFRQRARGRGRLSRQCECGRSAFARRHRPGPHPYRHLGRSRRHAQLPRHRGRGGFGEFQACRSRMCRPTIRRPAGSSRCRCWRRLRKLGAPLRVGT